MKRPVRRTQYENGIFYSVGRSARGKRQHRWGLMDADGYRTLGRVELQGVEGKAPLVSRAEKSIENTGYLV
jgi:hypothetical protein